MKKHLALKIILIVSILGMLFSGYLSFIELSSGTCAIGGGCQTIVNIPACVYGLLMYLVVFVIALLGIKSRK